MAHFTRRMSVAAVAVCLLGIAVANAADDAAKLPVIEVNDGAALKANIDKEVVLVGTCKQAAWSDTGKVLNVTFNGGEQTGVMVVAFAQSKKKLDEAFGGDIAKTLTGADLRVRGKLREYAGKSGQKARPEITITDGSQVTIVIKGK